MPRSKFTPKEKLDLLTEFKQSSVPRAVFSRQHGIESQTLSRWLKKYELEGVQGLTEATKNRKYSVAFKEEVVRAFLNGEGSLDSLTSRFHLRSETQISDWILRYNRDKTMAAFPSRKQVLTMSRKTTLEERIEIVEYVTEHKHTYSEAAKHYHVSYQQARLWVLKAKEYGYEGLVDGRGRRKPEEELTDLDKANLRIRQLESQVEDMKLMAAFIKKFKEIQRRG